MTFICRSFKQTTDALIQGIIEAYKHCPEAKNKTFAEASNWAGKHVILSEQEHGDEENG